MQTGKINITACSLVASNFIFIGQTLRNSLRKFAIPHITHAVLLNFIENH